VIGWHVWALAGVLVLYVFIAVFRSAYATLSPVALRRLLTDEQEGRGRRSWDPLGIRVAFDISHHLVLIAGAILLVAERVSAGGEHPYAISAGILILGAVVAQLGARVVALANPERAFSATWHVAAVLYRIFMLPARPVIAALETLRLSARREMVEEAPEAAAEEIEALIDVGRSEGILEVEEGKLIRQVIEFHDRVAREIMTPRTQIVAVPAEARLRDLRELMVSGKHSRVPVYRGQIDNIEGIAGMRDLIACWGSAPDDAPITPLVRPVHFVPETKQVSELLKEMQSRRLQMVMVVDEYGGIAGLVTIEDLLEEIVGELHEEHEAEEKEVTPEEGGRFLLRGTATIDAMNTAMGIEIPAEGYETVAGFVYSLLGRIPRAGEVVEHDGLRIEIVKADSRRVVLVRAARPAHQAAARPQGS
jgi:CBS domain containing-hemolysin-like protein